MSMSAIGAVIVIAFGAIITWGVADRVDGVAFDTIGMIIMAAGAAGLVISLFTESRQRRALTTDREVVRTPDGQRERMIQH
jgi:uncharacterized membrane protein